MNLAPGNPCSWRKDGELMTQCLSDRIPRPPVHGLLRGARRRLLFGNSRGALVPRRRQMITTKENGLVRSSRKTQDPILPTNAISWRVSLREGDTECPP